MGLELAVNGEPLGPYVEVGTVGGATLKFQHVAQSAITDDYIFYSIELDCRKCASRLQSCRLSDDQAAG